MSDKIKKALTPEQANEFMVYLQDEVIRLEQKLEQKNKQLADAERVIGIVEPIIEDSHYGHDEVNIETESITKIEEALKQYKDKEGK